MLPSKNRVLYHHRTQAKGAERAHILGVIDALKKRGYSVDVVSPPGVTLQDKTLGVSNSTKRTSALSYLALILPQAVFALMEILYNFYSIWKLIVKVIGHRYLFIYDRYSIKTISTLLVSKLFSIPLIIEVNDATIITRSRPLQLKLISRSIESQVFKHAKIIVTVSNVFKNKICQAYKVDPEKILVLPNAVDIDKFNPSRQIEVYEPNVITKDICVGCVGAFVEWHGLENLLHWTQDLLRDSNIRFLFVGDGPVREAVVSLSNKYNIQNKVEFTGFVDADTVSFYLDQMDICLIPNSNEHGSPMKLFEYMAMGKASLVPAYAPILEVVTDEVDALVFSPNDKISFMRALLRLITDCRLRMDLGRKARTKVETSYTWDKHTAKLLDVLTRKAII